MSPRAVAPLTTSPWFCMITARGQSLPVRPVKAASSSLQGFGQREPGVHQVDPDHLLAEVVLDQAPPLPAAAELVDDGGVEMDHEPARHQMVQDSLHRRALHPLGVQARRQHRLLEGGLPLVARGAEVALEQHLESRPVQVYEVLRPDVASAVPLPLTSRWSSNFTEVLPPPARTSSGSEP